jgi:hypothetical protein
MLLLLENGTLTYQNPNKSPLASTLKAGTMHQLCSQCTMAMIDFNAPTAAALYPIAFFDQLLP